MPYPTTPKTWVAGDVLTAAQMNAELRDALLSIFPLGPPDLAWTTWAPTWSGTIGNGTKDGKYTRIGRTVHFSVQLDWGSTTTHPAAVQTFSIPVPARAAALPRRFAIGVANIEQTGVSLFDRTAIWNIDSGSMTVGRDNTAITNTVPFTWASGHKLWIQGTYEAAT